MADNENSSAGSQALRLEKIYVKGLLFEALKPMTAARGVPPPAGDAHIGNLVEDLGENRYEVILEVKINAKDRETEEPRYRLELRQAGIFHLQNFSDAERTRVLNVYCPNVLFPYARQQVSGAIMEGGFPTLILAPINFEELFRQQVAGREQSAGAEPSAKH